MKITLRTNKNLQKELRFFIDENLNNLNSKLIENIKIASCEAIQNIQRHAYKNIDGMPIKISLIIKDNILILDIYDDAEPCNPKDFMKKEFIPSESGHMGLNIIKKITKSFEIFPKENGNHTQLIFSDLHN